MAIRLERLRVKEALNARDVAVGHLADACVSVRQKTEALDALREEKETLQRRLRLDLASQADKENIGKATSDGASDDHRGLAGHMRAIENKLASLKVSEGGGVLQALHGIESDYKVCPVSALLHAFET